MAFLWRPGNGCDRRALARMRDAFPLPREPMGEAWFMGRSRGMYTWLYDDLDALPLQRVETALEAIASGKSSFGAFEEWELWFHYLLPRLLPRCHETRFHMVSAVLDALVTAFITQYPAGIACEPYAGFRTDAVATLGCAMMDEVCWPDGDLDIIVGLAKCFYRNLNSWRWYDVSEKLSASLFFCLKYLDPADVEPWLASALDIRSPYWVGQMIAWLVGAHPLLTGDIAQPADLRHGGYPEIDWFWSHVLTGNYSGDHSGRAVLDTFIPEPNRHRAMTTIAAHVNSCRFADWLATISEDPALEADLGDLPFELCRLYARH